MSLEKMMKERSIELSEQKDVRGVAIYVDTKDKLYAVRGGRFNARNHASISRHVDLALFAGGRREESETPDLTVDKELLKALPLLAMLYITSPNQPDDLIYTFCNYFDISHRTFTECRDKLVDKGYVRTEYSVVDDVSHTLILDECGGRTLKQISKSLERALLSTRIVPKKERRFKTFIGNEFGACFHFASKTCEEPANDD